MKHTESFPLLTSKINYNNLYKYEMKDRDREQVPVTVVHKAIGGCGLGGFYEKSFWCMEPAKLG